MGDFKKSLIIKVDNETNEHFSDLCAEIGDAFDSLDFGKIVIGAKMPSSVGGYYTKKQHCPGIYLPQSKDTCIIDEENEKFIINFTPSQFSDFVHEACHFLHMERDKGFWTHPSIIGLEPLDDMTKLCESGVKNNFIYRRSAEIEAGLRSVQMIRKYGLSLMYGKLNHASQITNILVYDINKQSWYKKYIDLNKKLSKEDSKTMYDKIINLFIDKYNLLYIPMDYMKLEEYEIKDLFEQYEANHE